LRDLIVEGMQEKKAEAVVSIDLSEVEEAVCDHFVICHAGTGTQVKAIAESVMKIVKEKSGEFPWQKEGFQNLEWVLIDYADVVAHIFIKEMRTHYRLEDLWSDGIISEYEEKA